MWSIFSNDYFQEGTELIYSMLTCDIDSADRVAGTYTGGADVAIGGMYTWGAYTC
jgi:hypothetical protein